MNIFYCTRNQPYLNPECLGHTDLSCRQGYYIEAEFIEDALDLMQEMYPDDTAGFTCLVHYSEPDNKTLYFYHLYRKSEFLFLGGEPLDEVWATRAKISEANDDLVPRGYIWVKVQD